MASLLSSPATERRAQCGLGVNVANFVSAKLIRNDDKSNYISWKEQMLCLMESEGVLGFIDGNAPPPPTDGQDYAAWRRDDRMVKGWILGALSDGVVESVVNFNSGRDVWLELEKKFTKPKRAAPPPAAQQGKEYSEYLPLYRAAVSGDWDVIKAIMEQDPDAAKARLTFTLETVVHLAVSSGNSTIVVKLVDFISDDSALAMTDGLGYNPLHLAALTGNLPVARILVHRLPDLLYVPCSRDSLLPVHIAAEFGHRQTLEFLISETRDHHHLHTNNSNPFAGDSGVLLLSYLIDSHFFDLALDLVDKYPHLARLKHGSTNTSALGRVARAHSAFSIYTHFNFWERLIYSCEMIQILYSTALTSIDNQSAALGETKQKILSTIWKLMTRLVPSNSIKGIHEKKLRREQALTLVKCLCKHMESLTYIEASAIYKGAVLAAAQLGIHEVIQVIVDIFPPAIYTNDKAIGERWLHLAVRNRCENVFNLIYQTTNHRYQYINSTTSSSNTILHLAATLAPPHKLNLVSGAALQMQRELQWFKEVEKFITVPYRREWKNKAGKTADMVFTEHKHLKEQGEKWMKDTANSCTIAAALIATVVFAAAITVPGGNQSDTGYPMFLKSSAFTIFAVADAVSLFTSTTSMLMFLSILTSRYAEQDFLHALPKRLCIGLVTLFLSILFMMVAFSSTLYIVFGREKAWILIPVAALACLPITSFVLLQFPLLLSVISSTYGRGIFGKQSDRPFH